MLTLYQKYRPRNFSEFVNQNHIKITLQNEIESDQISHAYLFNGPRGTGKTTMARILSKALNCEQRSAGTSEPCGECQSCQQISMGLSLDIIEIDAASHTGVDNVRDNIISNARIAVSSNRYKVFIIDEVHMLSTSAFNALLKILEEPPKKVIFILATTEVHKLPATIISRCQRFDFKRISITDIVKKLEHIIRNEGVQVEPDVLHIIARQSSGHMRDAESLLGQILSVGGKNITTEHADLVIPHSNIQAVVELIGFLASKDATQAIYLVNQLLDEGVDLRQFTSDLVEYLRRLMLSKVSTNLAEKFSSTFDHATDEKLSSIIQKLSVGEFAKMINIFMTAHNELKTAFIVQLPIEIAIINITDSGQSNPSEGVKYTQKVKAALNQGNEVNDDFSVQPIDLKNITDKWNEVLVKIKKYNHSLSFILRVCELRDQNGSLCLAFKYKFHQDRVEQPKIKEIMKQVLREVYGQPVNFVSLLDEDLQIDSAAVTTSSDVAHTTQATNLPTTEQNVPSSTTSNEPIKDTELAQDNKDQESAEQPKETAEEKKDANKDVDAILKMFGGKIVG